VSVAPSDLESLREFPIFEGLGDGEAQRFADAARVVSLTAGQPLFRQGERGDALFLLVAGRLDVFATEKGVREELATLEAGAVVGEVSVLIDAARTASAVAVTDARLWEITRNAFRGGVASRDEWALVLLLAVAGILAERVAAVDARLLTLIAAERGEDEDTGSAKVAELERLRRRLVSDWTF
jgi:CRP-like cAMP-binding protein